MKLTKQLPVALGLACALMLGSCSKEDVQSPEPKEGNPNINSNLKVEGAIPFIPSTQGYLGINIFLPNWDRNEAGFSSDEIKYPVGLSNRFNLWGDPLRPFVQSMSVIPGASSITSFITVTTAGTWYKASKSSVKTQITDLIIGKKYALTVYVGSSLPKAVINQPYPTFAKSCLLSVGNQETVVDLTNYKVCWVQKVITFTASGSKMDFAFSASPAQPGQYAYAHLLVPYAAIKQVN